jgi:hypothetical protein
MGRSSGMEVKGPVWLGISTSNFNAKVNLYRNIPGLDIPYQESGFVVMHLADGGRIEFFGDNLLHHTFFTNPETGFLRNHIALPLNG